MKTKRVRKIKTEFKFNELSSIAKMRAVADEVEVRDEQGYLDSKDLEICKNESAYFKFFYIYNTQIRSKWSEVFENSLFNKYGVLACPQKE